MTIQNVIRSLVEYHVASNRRLWDLILDNLSDEQFLQDTGFSHGSVRNQVVHLAATDRYWLHDIQSKPVTGLDAADYPDRESFTATWSSIGEALLDYVSSLSEADLEAVPDGLLEARWQALVHIANHGTDHRAQVLSMLHGMGAPTTGQDFPDHLRVTRWVSKSDVLGLIRYWHGRFIEALATVPSDRLDEPIDEKWTVREILAQRTWYDREMAEAIEARQLSNSGLWGLSREERDGMIARESKAKSWEELLQEHELAHRLLVESIERLDDPVLNDTSLVSGLLSGRKLWEALEDSIWSKYLVKTEALWTWSGGGG